MKTQHVIKQPFLLEYGADGQRVKAVFKYHGHVVRTRYYISANYEKEVEAGGVTTHYNYVYGVNGLAAICVRRNGVDSMYYVHPDRLGSYTHITNSSKQVVRALHFDEKKPCAVPPRKKCILQVHLTSKICFKSTVQNRSSRPAPKRSIGC